MGGQAIGVIYEATVLEVKGFRSWKATQYCFESSHVG